MRGARGSSRAQGATLQSFGSETSIQLLLSRLVVTAPTSDIARQLVVGPFSVSFAVVAPPLSTLILYSERAHGAHRAGDGVALTTQVHTNQRYGLDRAAVDHHVVVPAREEDSVSRYLMYVRLMDSLRAAG